MYGFILTTHFNNYSTVKKCLNLLFQNIPDNSFVILYVNETTCEKVLNIKNDYLSFIDNFDVIYINNQEINDGLTGTWNQGINYLLNKNNFTCKVITILGHDTFVNNNIKYLLSAALNSENNKKLEYFGPLYKNFIGKNDELWQDELYYKQYSNKFIIGSLFTFPIHCLIKNRINEINTINKPNFNNYFDAKRFPFGYNDIDWYNRFVKIGGKAVIIPECIIDHKYERSWIPYDKNLKKYYYNINNTSNDISNNNISKDNKKNNNDKSINSKDYSKDIINENDFNWISYLQKNIDLQKKGIIRTSKDAINHYLTVGRYKNRKF